MQLFYNKKQLLLDLRNYHFPHCLFVIENSMLGIQLELSDQTFLCMALIYYQLVDLKHLV